MSLVSFQVVVLTPMKLLHTPVHLCYGLVILALSITACDDGMVEPEPVPESCEQIPSCERTMLGSVEAISIQTDGKITTTAKVEGEEVLSLEWVERKDSVDLIITLPGHDPLDPFSYPEGLPALTNANMVAAVIIGLNSSDENKIPGLRMRSSLPPGTLSTVDHGANHSGCDVINGLPLIGSCSVYGGCCDEHDICINTNCKGSDSGDVRECLTRLARFPLAVPCSLECMKCHIKVIGCYRTGLLFGPGPARCCADPALNFTNTCGLPQQCILPGNPSWVEINPCNCPPSNPPQHTTCGPPPDSSPCNACGDVHMRTPDGLAYDFQGAGEYLFVASTDGSVIVQTRMEPWHNSELVSVNTAVTMNVNGDRVGVYLDRASELFVNGQPAEIGAGSLDLAWGGRIYLLNRTARKEYLVVWPNGFVTSVKFGRGYLDVGVSMPAELETTFEGLVGNLNGESFDDIRTREGTTLERPVSFQDLYHTFGDSWRITATESLFDYEPGTSTETYTLPSFPRHRISVADFGQADVDAARQVCEDAGIQNPILLQDCMLDILATGEHDFAESALDSTQPQATLDIGLLANGGFDQGAEGWSWQHVISEGGWQPNGGNPAGNFILNQAGENTTDPTLCQTIHNLKIGQQYQIVGDYASYKPSFGNAQKADAFAVTLNGTAILELARPSPIATNWTTFSTVLTANTSEATLCFVAERNGDDSSFRVDNLLMDITADK